MHALLWKKIAVNGAVSWKNVWSRTPSIKTKGFWIGLAVKLGQHTSWQSTCMVSSNLTMSNFLAPCFLFVSCQIDFLQKIHCVFIYVGNVAKNATSPFFNMLIRNFSRPNLRYMILVNKNRVSFFINCSHTVKMNWRSLTLRLKPKEFFLQVYLSALKYHSVGTLTYVDATLE